MESTAATDIANPTCLGQVSRTFGLRMIVLFASRAHRHPPPGSDSDVDLALLGCPRAQFFECYRAFAYRDFIDSADLFALEETLFRKRMDRIGRMLRDPA